jgi:hypothetical protein
MKLAEKLEYLQDNHFDDWLTTRQKVDIELSDRQSMFCVCGRLATGFHEKGCRRFNDKVNSETIKRLKHLLPRPGIHGVSVVELKEEI